MRIGAGRGRGMERTATWSRSRVRGTIDVEQSECVIYTKEFPLLFFLSLFRVKKIYLPWMDGWGVLTALGAWGTVREVGS